MMPCLPEASKRGWDWGIPGPLRQRSENLIFFTKHYTPRQTLRWCFTVKILEAIIQGHTPWYDLVLGFKFHGARYHDTLCSAFEQFTIIHWSWLSLHDIWGDLIWFIFSKILPYFGYLQIVGPFKGKIMYIDKTSDLISLKSRKIWIYESMRTRQKLCLNIFSMFFSMFSIPKVISYPPFRSVYP